jgi:hypothetical protein
VESLNNFKVCSSLFYHVINNTSWRRKKKNRKRRWKIRKESWFYSTSGKSMGSLINKIHTSFWRVGQKWGIQV